MDVLTVFKNNANLLMVFMALILPPLILQAIVLVLTGILVIIAVSLTALVVAKIVFLQQVAKDTGKVRHLQNNWCNYM
jgi:hypothetical protein